MSQTIREFAIHQLYTTETYTQLIENIYKEFSETPDYLDEAFKAIYDEIDDPDTCNDFFVELNAYKDALRSEAEPEEEEAPVTRKYNGTKEVQGDRDQKTIIAEVKNLFGDIKIPNRKNVLEFDEARLVEHITYWVSLHFEAEGKYSASFMKEFHTKDHYQQLEKYQIPLEMIQFTTA